MVTRLPAAIDSAAATRYRRPYRAGWPLVKHVRAACGAGILGSVGKKDKRQSRLGGRYLLLESIGFGGMSAVYRARDEALGRDVAVKVFRSGSVDVSRQEGELAILAQLDHHGLVCVLDAGSYRDDLGAEHRYIVMALVRGTTLRERLRGPRIPARDIADLGYDLAEALEYVHANGVTHRDVKPSNILLVDYGLNSLRMRAKLTDFGIALSEEVDRLTVEGQMTGTVAYLSPEQAAGEPVGPAGDVYSLGLVLLQCLTRTLEFPGTPGESASARLARDPVVPEYLPPQWQSLLTSMTARNPALRPSTRDIVSALRQLALTESARHKDDDYAVRTGELDTIPDETLHRVTAMAARLFDAPLSAVSVRDSDRTWLVSHYGDEAERLAAQLDLSGARTPRTTPLVIGDTRLDARTRNNPLVTVERGIRFYVGVPLTRANGDTIGTLSVADFAPGAATDDQLANLTDLGALVVAQLELRNVGMRARTDELAGAEAS